MPVISAKTGAIKVLYFFEAVKQFLGKIIYFNHYHKIPAGYQKKSCLNETALFDKVALLIF